MAAALNAHAPPTVPVRFVPPAELPADASYEAFIAARHAVPTRDNGHDAFNGLAWLRLPRTKARLNALQAAEIARDGVRATRGPVRDAATVFDENAVLLHAPDALWQALRERRWAELFGPLRPLWRQARVLVFGAGVDMAVRLTLLATEPVASTRAELTCSLRYAPSDPYAVSVVFPAGPSATSVTWTFDRDLLRVGVHRRTGLGDVQIWPAADDALTGGAVTYVELTAPGGRALAAEDRGYRRHPLPGNERLRYAIGIVAGLALDRFADAVRHK